MGSGDLPGRRSCVLHSETCIRSGVRRNVHMKYAWLLILCFLGGFILPGQAQEKPTKGMGNAVLQKELYEVELKWMKAEHDKKLSGPDSMGEMWQDEFFDGMPDGRVVNNQRMLAKITSSAPKLA